MPQPKRRHSKSRQGKRRANYLRMKKPQTTKCPQCGVVILPHTACGSCGTYKGRQVLKIKTKTKTKKKKES